MRFLLPSPWLSFGIGVGWLLLNRSLSPGHLLLAVALGLVMPLLTAPLRPRPGPLRNLPLLIRLILRVGGDVVRSAIAVGFGVARARWETPRGSFVVIPLDLRDTHGLAALAMITTVIPGTVWCELAPDHASLLLHVFDLDDEASFIHHYKSCYEDPLKEIFQ